jgi:hypothetical protein
LSFRKISTILYGLMANQFREFCILEKATNAWVKPVCGLILLTVLLFSHALRVEALNCFSPPAGMISWWPGDGNANDIQGTNHGSLQGTATATGAGEVGTAFTFDGTNGYLQIADAPTLRPTNFTMEAWVRFTALDTPAIGGSPAGDQYVIFRQNSRSSGFEGFELGKTRIAGSDVFSFMVSSSTGQYIELDSITQISVGIWYHVAIVRGTNFLQLFVNGELQASAAIAFPQDYGNFPLYFGTSGQPSWDHKFSGALDEVAFYSHPLGSDEIMAIYSAGIAGKCSLPRIITAPASRTVGVGANLTLSVTAAGTAPLGYQWLNNGVLLADGGNLAGTATSELNFSNAHATNSGNYQVIITNTVGAITSQVAVLTVDPSTTSPIILTNPIGQAIYAGQPVSFHVDVSGSPPLAYRWQLNGTDISDGGPVTGATNATLSIPYPLLANAGNYSVVITNSIGSVTSAPANLAITIAPGCLAAPSGLVGWWPGDGHARDIVGTNHGILQGGATASVSAVSGTGFGMDGTNGFVQIPNAPQLNPTNLSVECWVRFQLMDTPGNSTTGAQYVVFKQNTRNSAFEGYNLSKHRYAADIFVWEVSSAGGQAVQINGTTALQSGVWYHVVGVRGTNFVQLYVNGQLEAEGSVNFPQDYGNYPLYFGTSNESYWDHKLGGTLDEVALYNRALSPGEISALYAAGPSGKCKAPLMTTQPQGGVYYLGGSITLTAAASGLGTLAYQWQKDGAIIPSATQSRLSISNLQTADAGNYSIEVTNSLGSVSSSNALIQLKLADWSIAPTSVGGSMSASLTIAGQTGQTYGIQSCDDLSLTNWVGRTNLVLGASPQAWSDPDPMILPARYYRLLPGPIPVP